MQLGWLRNFVNKHKKNPAISRLASSKKSISYTTSSLTPTAQNLAQAFPNLLLASEKIANTVLAGSHGRKRTGQGSQFWQYREAVPGEPIHAIDWRQSAKSDKTYVRETEEEQTQTLYLWCDVSGSMQWRSNLKLPLKQERAFLLALALSSLVLKGGERLKLINPTASPYSVSGIHQLHILAQTLLNNALLSQEGLPNPEQIAAHAWTVFISDFLYPYDQLVAFLKKLTQRPNKILLIQITDPAEHTLPYKGRIHFTGLENEQDLVLSNNDTVSQDYMTLWSEYQKKLHHLCNAIGVKIIHDCSDVPAINTLLSTWNILSDKRHSK